MIDKLKEIIDKYNNLAEQLSQQDIISNMALYKKLSQEYSGLKEKVDQIPSLNVLNGIAYHPQRETFFVTGKNWSKIFEVTLHLHKK